MDSVRIDLDVPLSSNPVTKNAAIVWPTAIDARLDHLLSLVVQQHRTDRRELAAAIIFSIEADPARLGELLGNYRGAITRDALPHLDSVTAGANVVELPKHKPGPRPRAAM